MKTYIEVLNFGKIRSAKVAYGKYTVFVGDNNSGKSYLMQLIYSIGKYISLSKYDGEFSKLVQKKLNASSEFNFSKRELYYLIEDINKQLDDNKEKIVFETFRRPINIDSLKLDVVFEDDVDVSVKIIDSIEEIDDSRFAKLIIDGKFQLVEVRIDGKVSRVCIPNDVNEKKISDIVVRNIFYNHYSLYLPAARAGIQLLYKDFFTARADSQFYGQDEVTKDIQLTEPIYEYLRFLQRLEKDKYLEEERQRLLEFIDDAIIDGKIIITEKNEVLYSQRNGAENIPLYAASSMIGEMAPIVEFIQSLNIFDYLFIDEVEASLNPKKQREVARLLNRLRNLGIKLFISTHSDSMAAYINNLLIVSLRNIETAKLTELNLSCEDILDDPDVNFYEFRNMNDGTSIVEDLEVKGYPNEGVEFNIFNENIDMLYDETSKILGVKQ